MMRRGGCCLALVGILACGPSSEPPGDSEREGLAAATETGAEYAAARERARALGRNRQFDQAIPEALRALALAPDAFEPHAMLSELFLMADRDGQAAELFAERAAADPANPHPWHYKGYHEYRLGLWDRARESFEKVIEIDPDHAQAHYRLGTVYHSTGRFDRAIVAFRRAWELDPGSSEKAAVLSRLLRIVGEYEQAEQVLVEALALMPDSAELHYGTAQQRMRQGRDDEAERELLAAIRNDPDMGKAHRDLARLLLRSGRDAEGSLRLAEAEWLTDYARIHGHLRSAANRGPGDPQPALALAELELAHNRVRSALRWFDRAEVAGGSSVRIGAGRAWAFLYLGEVERARAEVQKLIREDDPSADLARAALDLYLGDRDGAARRVDEAVAAAPDDLILLRRAAHLYRIAGFEAEADALVLRAARAPLPLATSI